MKKLIFAVLALMFLAGSAWAASATVTETCFGYSITNGTDATYIAQDTWVTATAYTIGQTVIKSGTIYKCLIAHTSGTFATDLAANDWVATVCATIWVNEIGQKAASTTDTSIITSGAVGTSQLTVPAEAILNTSHINYTKPHQLVNPKITLAAAGDIVYIVVDRRNY